MPPALVRQGFVNEAQVAASLDEMSRYHVWRLATLFVE